MAYDKGNHCDLKLCGHVTWKSSLCVKEVSYNLEPKIAELLAEKYNYLYNSVLTTESEVYEKNSTIKNHITNVDLDVAITPHIIETCTKRLKRGKDDGNHGLK